MDVEVRLAAVWGGLHIFLVLRRSALERLVGREQEGCPLFPLGLTFTLADPFSSGEEVPEPCEVGGAGDSPRAPSRDHQDP